MTSFNTVADKPYGDGEESRDKLSIPPGPQSRLEPLSDHESVWLLLQYFDGIRSTIEADNIKRALVITNGDLGWKSTISPPPNISGSTMISSYVRGQ